MKGENLWFETVTQSCRSLQLEFSGVLIASFVWDSITILRCIISRFWERNIRKKKSLSHFQSPQHSQITQFLCKQSLTIRIERLWMACNAPPRKDRFGKTLNVCSHQTCILGFVSERELFVILVQELPSTNRTYLVVVSFLYGHFSPSSTKPTCYPKSDAFKKIV